MYYAYHYKCTWYHVLHVSVFGSAALNSASNPEVKARCTTVAVHSSVYMLDLRRILYRIPTVYCI